jgi:hypothetical protein
VFRKLLCLLLSRCFSAYFNSTIRVAANPIFEPEKCKAYIAYTCKMCILNNKVRYAVGTTPFLYCILGIHFLLPRLPHFIPLIPSSCLSGLHYVLLFRNLAGDIIAVAVLRQTTWNILIEVCTSGVLVSSKCVVGRPNLVFELEVRTKWGTRAIAAT